MALDSENDLSRTSLDDEHSMESSFDRNSSYITKNNYNKLIRKPPKSNMICVVCGDNAFGYNFDAVSCESCKAFFRRTALRPPEKLKCRGNGHCEVTVEKRKRCKKCRLEKCFRMGMRKEWILSEEEKQIKKKQIEENRRLKRKNQNISKLDRRRVKHSKIENESSENTPNSLTTDDILSMTELDWSRINQVQLAYSESIAVNKVIGVPSYPATQRIHSELELIRIPTYLASIRLIAFLKRIPEFHSFHLDDRVTLVKYNLLAVVLMHTVLLYDPKQDTYHEANTEDPIFQGKDWIEILGDEFYHKCTDLATKLIKMVQNDRIVIKIFLLLILFTKGFCGYDIVNEPSLKDHSIVYKTQNLYLELLYKYCIHHYGLSKTETLFIRCLPTFLSVQSLAVHLKDCVHDHIVPSQLSPLMQSVLQMTDTTSPT